MLDRLEILIGNNIDKLKNTTVLIVGIGGVGGHALESIARSGIGKIVIVDSDIVDITNLNRQIISNKNNIGLNKVDVSYDRIKEISNSEVIKINEFITKNNVLNPKNLKHHKKNKSQQNKHQKSFIFTNMITFNTHISSTLFNSSLHIFIFLIITIISIITVNFLR